jgi:hypothetical protein
MCCSQVRWRNEAELWTGQLREGQMWVGTPLFDREGMPVSALDCLKAEGLVLDTEAKFVATPSETPHLMHWFGALSRPEDYILTRTRQTCEETLSDSEWEAKRPDLIIGRLGGAPQLRVN